MLAGHLVQEAEPHGIVRVGNREPESWAEHTSDIRDERLAEHQRGYRYCAKSRMTVIEGLGGASDPAGVQRLVIRRRRPEMFEPWHETVDHRPCDGLHEGAAVRHARARRVAALSWQTRAGSRAARRCDP